MDISSPLPVLFNGQFDSLLLIIMIILIVLSAFFSMSETALTSSNRLILESESLEGKKLSQKAMWLVNHYEKILTTILVGNNIVNIALATIATVFFAKLITREGINPEVVSTIVITVLVLIFGEILPKTIAKLHANKILKAISYVLYFLYFLLFPIVIIFYGFQHILPKKNENDDNNNINEEQFTHLIDELAKTEEIEAGEQEAMKNILTLNDREVKDIMTPRVDIVCIRDTDDLETIKDIILDAKYSRIPVIHEDKDNVKGILYERDFFAALLTKKTFKLKSLLKDPKFVSANMKVDDLINELRKDKVHIAMVVGEYGEVIGLVTMEDALEEIVGEIYDEHDEKQDDIMMTKVKDNEYLINANIYLNDMFEELGIMKKVETHHQKLSTWLFSMTDDIPVEGTNIVTVVDYIVQNDDDEFEQLYKKLTFVVTNAENRRIQEVELFLEDITKDEALELQEEEE